MLLCKDDLVYGLCCVSLCEHEDQEKKDESSLRSLQSASTGNSIFVTVQGCISISFKIYIYMCVCVCNCIHNVRNNGLILG